MVGINIHGSTVIGLLIGAEVTFLVLLSWEYFRGDDAMIPLSMLRKRIIWSSCLTMFFISGVLTYGAYYLPIYFQAVQGASPIMSGVYYLPDILLQITMPMLSGIMGKCPPLIHDHWGILVTDTLRYSPEFRLLSAMGSWRNGISQYWVWTAHNAHTNIQNCKPCWIPDIGWCGPG